MERDGQDAAAAELLTGRSREHLEPWRDEAGECLLHRAVIEPLRALRARAARDGICLCVASGFRSFDRQLEIWNAKARGERLVLDDRGTSLAWEALADRDRVHAILRWSALPGASRHHWGTDLDVWDPVAAGAGYRLRLEPDEYGPGGPFRHLAAWLQDLSSTGTGFMRPYSGRGCGVAAEPWHLSFLPLAAGYQRRLTPELLRAALAGADLELKAAVLAELEEIHARYVGVPPLHTAG
jgi:LAS superfamily LD-carboxypeptidase LdcB